MPDAEELRKKAEKARRFAQQSFDKLTTDRLKQAADEYSAEADRIDQSPDKS